MTRLPWIGRRYGSSMGGRESHCHSILKKGEGILKVGRKKKRRRG